ncbi:glucose dehydrogenase [FAD, quinone]-like isoform X2 [Vanessa cardui]|uniref:glucose dehydrogenase [FAD, quinone]-like isoform X2 n=1 Tax=Vanessa cardui TaxID=171605 RepID=UPI001F129E67|nr:glucose dehydrogenase [FAD, quinone]-like isoform X2 [Vanessa cardui]
MDVIKRTNFVKKLQRWHIVSSPPPDLKTSKFHLEITLLVLTVAVAILLCGQFSSFNDVDAKFRSRISYYGDEVADGDEFDYIVVGAGAAGSAVAARLALAGKHVLLVEAGGDPNILTKIPAASLTLGRSNLDWSYDTLSNEKSCLASKGQRCRFTRGRCLGGSTSINYMMYTRGNREDYNFNISGWTWEDIEPYFLKYEGLQDLNLLPKSSAAYHNTSGVVSIGYFGDSGNPWHERIVEGFTSQGERVSTAKAYLELKGVQKNLRIAKNTQCTGVIIDENNTARGVTVSRSANETLRLYAKNEVVLSAGTIGSAQLLMLSGVGIKEHLRQFGIPVKADLSVGNEMSDHVLPLVNIKVDHDTISALNPLSIGLKGIEALQWVTTRSGPMTSNSLTDITAFLNSNCYNYTLKRLVNDRPECEIPNLQFIYAYIPKGVINIAQALFDGSVSFTGEALEQTVSANEQSGLIVISSVIMRPKSRGWIRLASSDPLAPPAIYPNYLSEESDVKEMVDAIKIIEQMVETPIYKKYNASINRLKISGCPDVDVNGYWECYVRHMTNSVYHAVGTAAIGRVVDERLRVKGINNLRVGDASVLPHLPRGNTAAAIIAIGERLADILLQDQWLLR